MTSVVLRLPTQLRGYVGGVDRLAVAAATAREALSVLVRQAPGLSERLLASDGAPRRHITLYLGTERLVDAAAWDRPLAERSEIAIIMAIAGG